MKSKFSTNVMKAGACLIMACVPAPIFADDIDDFIKSAQQDFNDFKSKNQKEFEDFRQKINREMIDFMKNPWVEFRTEKPKPKPVEPRPVVIDYDEKKEKEREKTTPPKPEPKPIKQTIVPPKPKPQPQPVAPVKIEEDRVRTAAVRFYGTDFNVAKIDLPRLTLTGNLSDDMICKNFEKLVSVNSDALLKSCLDARESHKLCDWGYIKLVEKVAESYYGANSNAARLLWGFLMQQSGYSIRFGYSGADLLPMFACDDYIYGIPYLMIDGEMFFIKDKSDGSVYVSNFKYPGEQSVTMMIQDVPVLAEAKAAPREVTVHSYPDIKLSVQVNKNLIDFYNDFPQSTIGSDPYARWALFANVPATAELRSIYPVLRNAIAGKNQYDAASILLKVAQSFPYGFDEEVWGDDRAFFPDESWFYPKSDCEDHAIHFSRLVRDLMNLDVALVYYPGHLSAAVAFTDNTVSGSYVVHNGRPYTFCDATYFYAPVGKPAPSNDSSQAILIDLKR